VKYDFDKVTDRRNTDSIKWKTYKEDVLPMWVADMDFEVAEPICEAIRKRASHSIYGYTSPSEEYYSAMCCWWKKRHDFELKKEWILFSPGVVPAVNMLIQAFTQSGDKVLIQVPVYTPFFEAIKNNGCQVVENPLINDNGSFTIDFKDLELKLSDPRVSVMILCSPHNPVGRVWTIEELTKIGELCLKYNVLVISDEIHSDLIYKQYKHTPFASICEEFKQNSATCVAPSKTFNLAGLSTSSVILPNKSLRQRFSNVMVRNGMELTNTFGIVGTQAAYKYGEEWLEELLDYLNGNLEYLKEYVRTEMPKIKVIEPEGTYLVWLDCTELGMKDDELFNFFLKEAKISFSKGSIFGKEGEAFERINIACPRTLLKKSLKRMAEAVKLLEA
jgi:cystathionine beta-lyase